MRTTRFIVALLLVLAAWQSSHAQGFRVYLNDGTFRQYSLRTDSIVFFDGAGEEVDYNPFAPNNASILGSWYDADGNELYFRKDGTTNYTGGHYKFMPYVGSLVVSDANGHPTRVIRVADLTKDSLLLSFGSASSFNLLTRKKPGISSSTPTAITCAEAVTLVNALTDGATSTETYTITGYITEVIGSVSRNQQSFWMADTKDGGKVFEAYWANLPEGVSGFTAGMKVTITGQLMKYIKNEEVVPEMKNATVVILEKGEDDPPVLNTSLSCEKAVQLVNALADGATSTETYSVTGYITEVLGSISRNQQSFWMADTKDGGKVFEAYWANLPEGIEAFTLGMKVTITGQLMKYVKDGVVTPEIKNATVVILEQGEGGSTGGGETGGGDSGTGGTTVTSLQNGGFETWVSDSEPQGWKSASTASNADLSKSTDARTGSFSCCVGHFETANKRLASQEMTLAAGTYKLSYYAKSTTADPCQTRAGYVPVTDGAVGSYSYSSTYTNLNNSTWTLVEHEFTLSTETTLCVLVMNPKNSSYNTSQDILVDDVTLEKQ